MTTAFTRSFGLARNRGAIGLGIGSHYGETRRISQAYAGAALSRLKPESIGAARVQASHGCRKAQGNRYPDGRLLPR